MLKLIRTTFSIILFIVVSLSCFGQSGTEKDTVPFIKRDIDGVNRTIGELEKYGNTNNAVSSSEENVKKDYGLSSDSIIKRLNLYTPDFYVGPMNNLEHIRTSNIFENEYTYHRYIGINNNSGISTTSSLRVYPGMGAVNNVSATYNYQPIHWLSMSLGAYISKQSYYKNLYNDAGVNANFKFHLNDRFRINMFGQYSIFGNDNDIGSNARSMYPQSLYGTSIEYKINEKFGVQGGFVRELDPMTGKWENRPFIAPVFYGK